MLINIQYLFQVMVKIKEAVASTVEPTVRAVYVFGSQARGDATASSDLDLGVVVDNPTGFEVFRFAAELEGRLGEEIDVAVLNDASPVLLRQVLKEGTCVYKRSDRDRVAFEVGARRRYFDMKPRFNERAAIRRERFNS